LACAVLFALVVAQWATPEERHATMAGLPWVLLYLGNWAKAAGGPHSLGCSSTPGPSPWRSSSISSGRS
jgi:hypothetical protein